MGIVLGAFFVALAILIVGLAGVRTNRAIQYRRLELEENERATARAHMEETRALEQRQLALETAEAELTRDERTALENARLADERARLELETAQKVAERQLEEGRVQLQLQEAAAMAAAVGQAVLQQRIEAEQAVIAAQREARVAHAEELVQAEIEQAKHRPTIEVIAEAYDKYAERELRAYEAHLKRLTGYDTKPRFSVKSIEVWAGEYYKPKSSR